MESDKTQLSEPAKKPGSREVLGYNEFRSYLGLRIFIALAYQMQAVIIGWHIYQLSHNTFTLGLIGLTEAVPALGITLFAGHFADHSDRKKMVFKVILGMLISSSILLVTTNPYVSARLDLGIQIGSMFSMIFINGLCRGFYSPSSFSLLGSILPRELYASSSTWSSGAFQISTVLGPAIGGLVLGYFGITQAFSLVIISQFFSLFFILSISNKPQPLKELADTVSIFESLKIGIKFVFSNKMMIGALSLDLFSVFFGGAVSLLPVYATDILHVGASGLGYLRSAPAVGSLFAMILMLNYSPINKAWRNLLFGVAGFGMATIVFAISQNFYLSLAALIFTGIFDSVSVIIRSTILQTLTPENMRGRVSSVNTIFISSSNEIGAFESGTAARIMGTVPSVLFGGGMVLLIVTATYIKTRDLLKARLN